MKYLPFKPLGRDLSRLVLGSMVFSLEELDLTFALMDAWLTAGGNVVDTAHLYNGGNSERALGRWLQERGRRDELVILGKGAHHSVDRNRVTPEDITCDLRDSLARLKTDRIDLYLLHRDDAAVPVGPIIDVLNHHRREGRIGAFGVSNWLTERIDEANRYAAERGLEGFTASSPHLSLAQTNEPVWPGCVSACDADSLAWYERTQLPLFSWSSQARGFFTGRFGPDDPLMQRVYENAGNHERRRRAADLGTRKGGYSANQVALAWVLHQPFPTYALIGPRTLAELHDSLAALEIALTPEEVRWLNLDE